MSLRLLILGAHPDDAEFHAGGFAAWYRSQGHAVRMVSVTNGAAGHHQLAAESLAAVRKQEAADAAAVIGAESSVWEFPDGGLLPTLEVRERIIREIRSYAPDLVLTHRLCDYHPDHRAVAQAVQDASYLVTVPLVVPDTPHLRRDPVVMYMDDRFTKPQPLQADVVLDTDPWGDAVVQMLACHRSQVFEFLPYNAGIADQVPRDDAARLEWLRQWYGSRAEDRARRHAEPLRKRYGARAERIQWCEAFEVSEYAAALTEESRQRLFL